jgi:hypothetical protein
MVVQMMTDTILDVQRFAQWFARAAWSVGGIAFENVEGQGKFAPFP